jgi:hypothetical protein
LKNSCVDAQFRDGKEETRKCFRKRVFCNLKKGYKGLKNIGTEAEEAESFSGNNNMVK